MFWIKKNKSKFYSLVIKNQECRPGFRNLVSISKVLLEHDCVLLFMYRLSLLLNCDSGVEECGRDQMAHRTTEMYYLTLYRKFSNL